MRDSRNRVSLTCILMVMALLLMSGKVMAGSVKWDDLNSNEKKVLKAFQGEWNGLPDKKQNTLRRWAAKPAAERARIRKRYQEWKQLSPAQQQKVSKQLKRYREMPAGQKARLKSWHAWVKKLPDDERKKLRAAWPGMSDTERRAYMKELQKKYGRS